MTTLEEYLGSVHNPGQGGIGGTEFTKAKLHTALNAAASGKGHLVYLDAEGNARFDIDINTIEHAENITWTDAKGNTSPYRDWVGRDAALLQTYVDANRSTFYNYDNTVQIRRWREYAIPTAAADNKIEIHGISNSGWDLDITENSDDINGGDSTKWDCEFTITLNGVASNSITRTMDLHADDIGDSLLFGNYSNFFTTSDDAIWQIGTSGFFFAIFSYYSSTHACYRHRHSLIEFTWADPDDGNIKYHDFLAPNDADGDRVWASYALPGTCGHAPWVRAFGGRATDVVENDIQYGVYHDAATNIMYIHGAKVMSNSRNDVHSNSNAVTVCDFSIDLDDDTLLTTCCDEDMGTLRFFYNGVIQTMTVPNTSYQGYNGGTYRQNRFEGVSVAGGDIIKDVGTGKEYMWWGGRWYNTSQAIEYPYGILEINTGTTVATNRASVVNTTGSVANRFGAHADDRTYIYDEMPSWGNTLYNPIDAGDENLAGWIGGFKLGNWIVFAHSSGQAKPMNRCLLYPIMFNVSTYEMQAYQADITNGGYSGTRGTYTYSIGTATIATDTITYKWTEDVTTYELDYTIDPLELWGEDVDPETHATYCRIQFESPTVQNYIYDGTYYYAPCCLSAYSSAAGAAHKYKRLRGMVRFIDGNATSPVFLAYGGWQSHTSNNWSGPQETDLFMIGDGVVYMTDETEAEWSLSICHRNNEQSSAFWQGAALQRLPMESSDNRTHLDIGSNNAAYNTEDNWDSGWVNIVFDFNTSTVSCSMPLFTEVTPQPVGGAGATSPAPDVWGKRLPMAPLHFSILVKDNFSRYGDPVNGLNNGRDDHWFTPHVALCGPAFRNSDAVLGHNRVWAIGTILPCAEDATYVYCTTAVRHRFWTESDLNMALWRVHKTTLKVEYYPASSFTMMGGADRIDNSSSGHSTYSSRTYDVWTADAHFGLIDYSSTHTWSKSPFMFRPFDGRYTAIHIYYNQSTYYDNNHNLRSPLGLYDVVNGRCVAVSPHMAEVHSGSTAATAVQNNGWPHISQYPEKFAHKVLPDDNNGQSWWGFRWLDYHAQSGCIPITKAIGVTLGPTVEAFTTATRLTPVALFNSGAELNDLATGEDASAAIVSPAGNTVPDRYYLLGNNWSIRHFFKSYNSWDNLVLPTYLRFLAQFPGRAIRHIETKNINQSTVTYTWVPELAPLNPANVFIFPITSSTADFDNVNVAYRPKPNSSNFELWHQYSTTYNADYMYLEIE